MLIHDFYLSDVSTNPDFDSGRFARPGADVRLHDDLFGYIQDSLNWLPTFNPAKRMEAQTGLNRWGPTVLLAPGADIMMKVARAWATLFEQSPKKLELTGGYSWIEGEPPEKGVYERLIYDRDEVVSTFRALSDLCEQVAASENRAFIMHHGI